MTRKVHDQAGRGSELLEGEVLGPDDPGPGQGARRVREPGWIARNREAITQGREMALTAAAFAPPPLRLAVIGASLAIEGAFAVEDARSGRVELRAAGLRMAGLALDGAGLAAAARVGPASLARHAGKIAAARAAIARLDRGRAP